MGPTRRHHAVSLLLPLVTILVSACTGAGLSPTPATTTLAMEGRVYESLPTDSTPVAGVRVEVADGPNAGRGATTDTGGYYRIDGIQVTAASTVTVNIRATRTNYETLTQPISLPTPAATNLFIKPSFQMITETLTGEVSSASAVCSAGSFGSGPCLRFAAPAHYDGSLSAGLTYTPPDRSGNVIQVMPCKDPCAPGDVLDLSSLSWGGSYDVFGYAHAGVKYWVQVMWAGGTTPQTFALRVTRPN